MPSKSPAQARLMRAVAHGWKPDKIQGPTRAVAREFVDADRRSGVSKYNFGGRVMPRMPVGMSDPRMRVMGGPTRTGFAPAPNPRAQMLDRGPAGPPRGGLGMATDMMRGMQRPQIGGPRPRAQTPPPGKEELYAQGNPMLGGRNPMMRQISRFAPSGPQQIRRGPTSFLR